MAKSKFSSIEMLVNLPPMRPLNPDTEAIFEVPPVTPQETTFMTPQMLKLRADLMKQIQQEMLVFEDAAYNFKFPDSKFPDVGEGQKNNISYEQHIELEEEDTFANKLTDLQLAQIKEKGQFEVRSKSDKALIPYVWKINGCIFRGQLKRQDKWEEGLSNCYRLMVFAKDFTLEQVPKSIMELVRIPVKLFSLIFGRKKMQLIHAPNYEREVLKQFWADILNSELRDIKNQIGHEFLQQLYVKYESALYQLVDTNQNNEKYKKQEEQRKLKISEYNLRKAKVNQLKQKLRLIEVSFQNNWNKIRKNIISRLSTQIEDNSSKMMPIENDQQPLASELLKKKDQSILEKLHSEKYSIYVAHVKEHMAKQNINRQVMEAILTLVSIFSLISYKITSKTQRLQQIETKIRDNIHKRHPIRSRSDQFVEESLNRIYLPVKAKVEQEFNAELVNDQKIIGLLNPNYVSILKKYVSLKSNLAALIQNKQRTIKSSFQPLRIFRTTYILFPPFEILKADQYYSLKKKEQLRVDTAHHFWKCSLYAMRMKSWTLNCFKFLVGVCWASPLGLRCLFGVAPFVYDQNINSTTGVKESVTRVPFLGRFGKVLRGMKKSRNAFEALPDRGLFGKNCSRICNYLECYVFRFFFVGVIGVLMLYPIGIIVLSLLCLVGILTVWIWVPLCMVLCYLFNILIFQFQISYKPAGCLIRSIPLLSLVILIAFYLLKIVVCIAFLLVIAPLACILLFLYILLRTGARFLSDSMMLCLIGCLGRTPSRDTSIARKISGPGMSRNYFYSISEQDVYILTQSALERLLVQKISAITRNRIQENSKKYNSVCSFILKPFGFTNPAVRPKKDTVGQNSSQLLNNFNRKFNQYMARYPKNPTHVRFTQEQIQIYLKNCVRIVTSFVEKKNIGEWIFEEKNILNEDYEELTRILWVQIFNSEEIFEPIERIDNRFKLLDEENESWEAMNEKKGLVMKALEGEIDLEHKVPTFAPPKKSIISQDSYFTFLQDICNQQSSNSETNLTTDVSCPYLVFVPPRNLAEVEAYDKFIKDRQLRTTPNIIQQ